MLEIGSGRTSEKIKSNYFQTLFELNGFFGSQGGQVRHEPSEQKAWETDDAFRSWKSCGHQKIFGSNARKPESGP